MFNHQAPSQVSSQIPEAGSDASRQGVGNAAPVEAWERAGRAAHVCLLLSSSGAESLSSDEKEVTPNGMEGSGSGSAEEHPEGEHTMAQGFPRSCGGVAGPASQIPPHPHPKAHP